MPGTTTARRRGLAALVAGATVVSGAALLSPGTSAASSHREAPYIAGDPAVDNTDTYAFVSPDDANTVTLIANWYPFQEPAGGPNFYPWDPTAAYDINIDNNGDAKPDITYRWTFQTHDNRGSVQNGGVPGTFLYNNGPVNTLDDPHLLFKQTYTLSAITYDANGTAGTPKVLMQDVPVPPDNVGIASVPDFVKLREAAANAGTKTVDGNQIRSYAGQADDSFFLDLRVFDLLYGTNLKETGYDTLKEFNVNSIALQVPKSLLALKNDASRNPVIGVWSTTSRRQTRVFADTGAPPMSDATPTAATQTGPLVQVSRLGNPLVNEVVVPAQLKDYFNRSRPDQDGALLGEVQDPELPQLIEGVYGIKNPNKFDNPAAKKRNDLVAAFLTGFSKKVFNGDTFGGAGKGVLNADLNSLDLNQDADQSKLQAAEYLRLNMAVPPTSADKQSRLGAIGGDLQGFPNGRRLTDDVVDIEIAAAEGALVGQDANVVKTLTGIDGVTRNDRPFLSSFPYIADPHAGSDPRSGRPSVSFKQEYSSRNGYVTTRVTDITPPAPGGFVQLYRITDDGRAVGLGSMKLSGDGTRSVTKTFPVPTGTKITLNYRVFTDRTSPAESNRGVPTTITVR